MQGWAWVPFLCCVLCCDIKTIARHYWNERIMCVIVRSVTIGFLTREEVMISHRPYRHGVHHSFRHSPKKKKKTHQSINIIETIQPRIMREALKSMEVCGTKQSTDHLWHKCCHASCLIMALLFEYHNCNTLIFAFKQKCE